MNLNKLAVDVCREEGGKKNLDIAQVKEVIKIVFELLKDYACWDVLQTIDRH